MSRTVRSLVLAAVLSAGLALAGPAAAKSCFRVHAPATVDVGRVVTIRVDALDPVYDDGVLVGATPVEDRIVAIPVYAQLGRSRPLLLSPVRSSFAPSVWRLRFAFDRPGAWKLWTRSGANACAPKVGVLVRDRVASCAPERVTGDVLRPQPGPISARLSSNQIAGGRFSLHTGGFDPRAGHSEKILWVVPEAARSLVGHELVVTARNGRRVVTQRFGQAASSQTPGVLFPSIVDLPTAGCWLLTLRTGDLVAATSVRARG
jgi:hypothetical protein